MKKKKINKTYKTPRQMSVRILHSISLFEFDQYVEI